MPSRNFGNLLSNAVRETLETMMFVEVIPGSIKIGDRDFVQEDLCPSLPPIVPGVSDTGKTPPVKIEPDAEWGGAASEPFDDPWGDSVVFLNRGPSRPDEIPFDRLVEKQKFWYWASIKVHAPGILSVLFVLPQSLAVELTKIMYAGKQVEMSDPLFRDMVAELTNTLAGRFMKQLGGDYMLDVAETGTGLPNLSLTVTAETVQSRVVVADVEYPIITLISFIPN